MNRITNEAMKVCGRLFLCSTIIFTGCGGRGLVEVSGLVQVNGSPAAGASVMFHPTDDPEGVTAAGTTNAEGRYVLSSGVDLGVLPGIYLVTVSWPDPNVKATEAQMMMGTAEPGPDLLKGRYSSKQKSELRVEITSSTSEIDTFMLVKPK